MRERIGSIQYHRDPGKQSHLVLLQTGRKLAARPGVTDVPFAGRSETAAMGAAG